ncbi:MULTISPECIES: hypothetical protein [Curtobacterium]|uniref:hypothetical protein n=1 Tax=Curtobacterium TaxID=2034 RepID=UPI001AD95BC9|nr:MULTISPECIES: hypothetical protein [Curtobacterium]MBO9039867.1 hypothetical protein [Curtobacterium flaccumfaciens pv. flaccumfaciens]MDT0232014.1 hypothetical protein [Curtobacterium sp. BRB10]
MATAEEVEQARMAAQKAVFDMVAKLAPNVARYDNLEKLARAYRAAAGGDQPGSEAATSQA